ncbi:putative NAD-dependent epimerase/dehydratase domain-containing protein [Seiridium cardinale]|uniref:NAD-dependent epimerase/dehydratase domain-containing protein n=1 Tax=Seiridium cardinale TaxID=138064 RepID=A0ABR2Y128_9PEZI
MTSNILITGAAGYIGGSIVADFLSKDNAALGREHIHAAVRSDDQAKALSALGVNVLRLDLTDEKSVVDNLLSHKIRIVIHCASSIDPGLAFPLINALEKQKELSGEDTYFIHTSALSAFYENTGWSPAVIEDTGPIFDTEKQLADSYPIRKTDVAIIEHAKARGVASFVVIPSTVYGRGSGEWNQLSVVIPGHVQASLRQRKVHKFPEDFKVSGVHITDLTALYWRIIEAVLQNQSIPSGTEGYYFALAHDIHIWEFLDRLATALKARGLVDDSNVATWPNDEVAAESIGVPSQFLAALWKSGGNLSATRPRSIGWKPQWTKEKFLDHIDEEITDVLDLGKAKSSLIDSLFAAAKNS